MRDHLVRIQLSRHRQRHRSTGCSRTRTTSIVGGRWTAPTRRCLRCVLPHARPTRPQHIPPIAAPSRLATCMASYMALQCRICAVRIVRIKRARASASRLLRQRINRRQHNQCGQRREREAADDRAAKRRRRLRALPSASAMGIMPAIIAALVISTGRIRARAASIAASSARRPPRRALLGERDEQDGVRDGDADGHDRAHERLDVQRCSGRRAASGTTPISTAGTVETTTNASRSDWKFAASSRKMTITATARPAEMLRNVSRIALNLAADRHRRAARRSPARGSPSRPDSPSAQIRRRRRWRTA